MNKNRHFLAFIAIFWVMAGSAIPASAQPEQRVEQLTVNGTAIDAATVYSSRYLISLWGIEPVNLSSAVTLRARTDLDNLIGGQPINCEVRMWVGERPMARCLNNEEQDLALEMLRAGYAVVDRTVVSGTVFESQYKDVEKSAQGNAVGAWAVSESGDSDFLKYFNHDERLVYGWIIGVMTIPLAGLFFTWIMMVARFEKVERYLHETIGESEAHKKELKEQERFVVASMIEGEMSANKGKLEAFIIIYKDLLKSLRQSKEHRYQTNGEIVHDAPLLERVIYENNVNRLELLGPVMAGEIVSVYADIKSNPNYTTLDSSIPLDEAVIKVQKVVLDAEKLIPKIDKIIQSLHVTIRDKQTRQAKAA